MSQGFYKNRRLKSLLFLGACSVMTITPHFLYVRNFSYLIFFISVVIAIYGLLIISKNFKRYSSTETFDEPNPKINLPTLDILVAARDEENVITRLVERLSNLDYPANKLNIYIIDDGS